uniref:TCTP domain-containing protein n=1 Tax=Angiostrongylus cantonensis TaxID=6313 RepID=A0A0K0DP40_ANGCA
MKSKHNVCSGGVDFGTTWVEESDENGSSMEGEKEHKDCEHLVKAAKELLEQMSFYKMEKVLYHYKQKAANKG